MGTSSSLYIYKGFEVLTFFSTSSINDLLVKFCKRTSQLNTRSHSWQNVSRYRLSLSSLSINKAVRKIIWK
ncbi:hypothetical protein HanXRQr2_Chr15g0688041 [Helianthus annuus]|uniref:Uncharacterized protein n=1 Tax=Helianthus annuus TaxID=4232 RepID=A0A9K3H439_HELAN|nr:hypothetical protein HanXRQr2_Chr15g0688041 [Helianthus annuus]